MSQYRIACLRICFFFSEVLSSVEPGYLASLLPEKPPVNGESWQNVLQDVDKFIIPGLTHWHSPHFHAYFPTASSFPGIVGELFLSGLGVLSSDWVNILYFSINSLKVQNQHPNFNRVFSSNSNVSV